MGAATAYSWGERTGIALIVLSCVLYALLVVVPFLPASPGLQLGVTAGLVITGEGTFWVGCLFAGKEFMTYLRKRLWPANWRRKATAR